jgi:hypothetical protein
MIENKPNGELFMSKQIIMVDGQERLVREDTAKSYRGSHWAWYTLVMMILITLLLLLGGVIKLNVGSDTDKPSGAPYSEPGP